MVGGSLVAVPFLFYSVGWVIALSVFTLTVIAALVFYYYMVHLSHVTGAQSYRELVEKVVNKKLSVALDVFIIILYAGVTTSYINIASSSFISFLHNVAGFDANEYAVKAIISLCVILPLCFLKSLRELGIIAGIGSMFIFMTGCSIIAYFFINLGDRQLCTVKDTKTIITYGLRAMPDTNVGTAIMLFFMYVPAGHGYFAAHNIIPSMIKEMDT